MAWQFYDYMEVKEVNTRYHRDKPVYGPLPVKRWVPSPSDKRHRVSYKAPKAFTGNAKTGCRAVEYAQWLAARDGIVIPQDATPSVTYYTFPSLHEKTAKGRAVLLKHAFSVHWLDDKGKDVLCVEIPHCGWEPAPAVETTLPDNVVSLAPRARNPEA